MSMERWLRLIAGALIIISLLLALYHSTNWLWFTGIMGFNLFQSGFTNWCPMMSILRACGIK